MYIKQIIIQGFKSYKDQTVIEPFSPHSNVIVGRNGSGKSNFFAAIRFVLSDAYTQMGRDERQALLHEGSGSAVMSAYVEVIFDNSEERFPTGKSETIIRRTIGLKKDEYSLDRKNATKSDVMNLLESAGFSRSNPYYIVPQGRVTTLTNMKDSERLNLLKEVAGTQVYEQRRSESLKIMEETTAKRQKIDELLKYIEERLEELEEEKEELRGFQEKDRERRCLEYTIYSREQREIAAALDQIEDSRARGVENNEEAREQLVEQEKEIKGLGQEIKTIKNQIDLQKAEKTQMDDELRDHAKTRAQLELAVSSLSQDQDQLINAKSNFEKELKRLTQQIEEKEEELNQITPLFQQKKAEETRIRNEIQDIEATRSQLHAKQGRTSQFRTKKERDVFLNKEIQETTANGQKTEALQASLQKEIATLETTSQSLETEIQEMRERLGSRHERTSAASEQVSTLKDERVRLTDERKELWREEARIQTNLGTAKEENDKAQRELSNSMDQNTRRGLEAVRRLNLPGVYGTVGELMEVEDRYRTAVEVTAGNALFHYVVDNDDTATRLLDVLHREKLGRVTCMPLNRLKNRPTNFPEANDAIPMIRKIKYDGRYSEAFEHIFGKTIICPEITIASQYARSHGVSAITLAGDRSDKRGALTGGYYDSRRSRLEAIKNSKKWAEEYETLRLDSDRIRADIDRKGQEITQVNSEIQKAEAALQQIEESFTPLRHQILSKTAQLGATSDTLESKKTSLENVVTRISELAKQLQAYQNELRSDFKKSLSSEEESLLQSLSQQLSALQKQQSEVVPEASRLAGQKAILEETLRKNLYPRLDELKAYAGEQPGGEKGNLKEQQKDLKRIIKKIETLQRRLAESESEIERLSGELSDLESKKSELEIAQEEAQQNIQKQQKRMEKSIAKKALLSENAAEASRNIRDLGVLPEEAFSKFEKVPSQTIMKRLHKVNDALKKFSHVNKKAVEQYNNFTKQRDTLTKRREELDKSQSSIEDLISVLDQRKDEAIERTFRQVSKSFAEIFEKLVPAGRGRLVIQRKMDKNPAQDGDSSDEESRNSVENYTGVGITVSFNSKHDEQQKIQQLSGGQKSLCALGLIFAIQNCDPAPFYLFDEVDANLDSQYRSAVAQMIKENSAKDCQYICTTFRPELILTADKHYGVTYTNKTSSVGLVTKEECLRFVEGETKN